MHACCLVVALLCVLFPGQSTAFSKLLKRDLLRSECAITRRIIKSVEAGGQSGTEFDDRINSNLQDLVTINGVQTISLSFSEHLESIQVTYILSNYSTFDVPRHGVLKSSEVKITLAHREFLTKVEGFHNGSVVQQMTFTTEVFENGFDAHNKTTHTYGPYGSNTGSTPFSIEGYVVGFYGRFGGRFSDVLVSIGMYALAPLSKSAEFGGDGDGHQLTRFDDKPDESYAPTSRINILYINHGDAVDSFKTIYSVLGGDILQSDWHGGSGGNKTTIALTKDEAIVGLEGSTEGKYINHISFITRRGNDGSVTRYGPFGKAASRAFSFYGNILGFAGSYANLTHSISVYYT